MRIAFSDPRAFQFKLRGGGDPVLVRLLVEGLQQRGHEVRTVSRLNIRRVWKGRTSPQELIEEVRSVHEEMKRFCPDAWFVYGASATNPDFFGWWQNRARYVVSAGVNAGRRTGIWRELFQLVHSASLERADHVIAGNADHVDKLISAGVPRERITTMPLMVKGWDPLPSRAEARFHLGLNPQQPIIFSAARFSPDAKRRENGKLQLVLDLLKCVADLPHDSILVIAGDGEGRQQVEQAAAQLPKDRVRLVGAVEHADIKWYYAACDVVAYPSQIDRAWLVVLEAQMCGRPVVTMRTCSAESTVDAGRTGLLAKDLTDFRSLLANLVRAPERCQMMGAAAQDYVARTHSVAVRLGQIEAMLSGRGSIR